MKIAGFLVLILIFGASLAADLVAQFIATAGDNYSLSYDVRQMIKKVQGVPWGSIFFGLFFGLAVFFTRQDHNRVTKEEVAQFVMIMALITICLQYGIVLLGPILERFHIHPLLFVNLAVGLFVSLVAWKGLRIKLGGVGVFLTSVVSSLIAFAVLLNWGLPVNPQAYWWTIIGTFIGLFAAFDRT